MRWSQASAALAVCLCVLALPAAPRGDPIESEPLIVTVQDTSQILKPGDSGTVEYSLRDPIVCPTLESGCGVTLTLVNSHPERITISPCRLHWTKRNWTLSHTVTVSLVGGNDGGGSGPFAIGALPIESPSPLYGDELPGVVLVGPGAGDGDAATFEMPGTAQACTAPKPAADLASGTVVLRRGSIEEVTELMKKAEADARAEEVTLDKATFVPETETPGVHETTFHNGSHCALAVLSSPLGKLVSSLLHMDLRPYIEGCEEAGEAQEVAVGAAIDSIRQSVCSFAQ